ncbi:MAG: ethanolamine utilization protein EutN/carboxysome structural protein CcmL [uncultured bacterium]|nr:MAG: ethanolamine utilization protein EutN/carboxysome structural protein CcmL [uncultured bacterium]HLD44917.1 EutN/CcmL family microcompartment protein [bacterium]
MILCRVIGNVVATIKQPAYQGHKMLIVQPVDEHGNDKGKSFLSFDSVQAGVGDVVLVEQEGNCARQILGKREDPFHSVICGVVDKVNLE